MSASLAQFCADPKDSVLLSSALFALAFIPIQQTGKALWAELRERFEVQSRAVVIFHNGRSRCCSQCGSIAEDLIDWRTSLPIATTLCRSRNSFRTAHHDDYAALELERTTFRKN